MAKVIQTSTSSSKNGIIKVHCTCENDYQDKTLGKGVRYANLMTNGKGLAKCTVCNTIVNNALKS